MRFNTFLIICLWASSLMNGQTPFVTGEITDIRDGKTYQTIKINNIIWLTENMKFKTPQSDSVLNKDFDLKYDSYYYPIEENNNVCPTGFRIPKLSEWENYVELLIELKNIPKSSLEYSSYDNRKGSGSGILKSDHKLQFFNEPNPLNLKETGLIQGDRLVEDGAMNFWSRKDNSDDFKYHLHILPNDYNNHSHKHNIISKKKKKRKFAVRCVKDNE